LYRNAANTIIRTETETEAEGVASVVAITPRHSYVPPVIRIYICVVRVVQASQVYAYVNTIRTPAPLVEVDICRESSNQSRSRGWKSKLGHTAHSFRAYLILRSYSNNTVPYIWPCVRFSSLIILRSGMISASKILMIVQGGGRV
jgi:hypothetical protein